MRIPIAKIGLFLILILVLPPVFFTAYEMTNLYQNEQMIDSIYTQQLESVLFSIKSPRSSGAVLRFPVSVLWDRG